MLKKSKDSAVFQTNARVKHDQTVLDATNISVLIIDLKTLIVAPSSNSKIKKSKNVKPRSRL